jgi:hypothetical protein
MVTEENSIQFIRLVTGEDIISDVTHVQSDDTNYYLLNNPLKVVYLTGSKAGILSISLMQWVFWRICDEQVFTIYPEDVLTIAKPSDSMEGYYVKSIEHFKEMKDTLNERTEFETTTDDDDDEVVKNIMDLLKNSDDKKKLH